MALRLVQLCLEGGDRAVVATGADGVPRLVRGVSTTYDLAMAAIAAKVDLADTIARLGLGGEIDIVLAMAERRILAPIDHRDPAHLFLTGTGLTHLGSAEGRDQMHRDLADLSKLSDSMKMFRLGLEGGKPGPGQTGAQPEWFYKGNGAHVTHPEAPLCSPGFALDGSEEAEIAGVYVIGPDGAPWRLGFALANEFSDHVTEKHNYLYLAHSKLRPAAFGPELLVGPLPADIRGRSRILRNGETIWEKPFLSGEDHMCHSIANLERHHFKYAMFRQPGDVHVHFFGTATLSFSEGVQTKPGDVFEITARPFTLPLRNAMAQTFHDAPDCKAL